MSSPGLESVRYIESEKESYQPGPRRDVVATTGSSKQKKRLCGMPLWLLLTIIVVLIALAVGLGVGLGLGLTHQKRYVPQHGAMPHHTDLSLVA